MLMAARTETRFTVTGGTVSPYSPSDLLGRPVEAYFHAVDIQRADVTQTEDRKWFALTEAAAEAERSANVQPATVGESYTYDVQLDNQVIGSYALIRAFQKITSTSSVITPVTAGTLTVSPASSEQPVGDISVTFSIDNANANIYVRKREGTLEWDGVQQVPYSSSEVRAFSWDGDKDLTIQFYAVETGFAPTLITEVVYTPAAI